jgi:putative ABC transport system ATP-binding protein
VEKFPARGGGTDAELTKEQGCTILLVTHDNRILDIADRIVYMEDGRLADKSNAVALVE